MPKGVATWSAQLSGSLNDLSVFWTGRGEGKPYTIGDAADRAQAGMQFVVKTLTKNQHITDGRELLFVELPSMGFYEDRPPRHGHRTPTELAEDELLSALHGHYCAMPECPEPKGPASRNECLPKSNRDHAGTKNRKGEDEP